MSAQRNLATALGLVLIAWPGACGAQLAAKPPYDPPDQSGALPWNVDLLGFVGGLRYRAPSARSSEGAHQLGLALQLAGERPPRQSLDFTYYIEALAGVSLGRVALNPEGDLYADRSAPRDFDGSEDRAAVQTARFLFAPGDNFYAGVTRSFSETTRASALIGRFAPRDRFDDRLLGAHGALVGGQLRVEDADRGELVFTPLHRPSLAGGAATGAARATAASADALWRRKLAEASERRHDAAHRLSAILRPGDFRAALSYEYSRLPAPEGVAEEYQPGAYDRIERASLGAGYARRSADFAFEAYLTIERVQGERRALLFNDQSRPETRIAGHALFAGTHIRLHEWFLAADFFLPEPPVQRRGSATRVRETSGYLSYGQPAIAAPILTHALFASPAPHLPRRDARGTATDAYSGEWEFRNPAGALAARLGFAGQRNSLELQATWLHPLADRTSFGGSPFRTLRRDPEQARYFEASAQLSRSVGRSTIALQYSRLYRKRPGQHSETAAEQLNVEIQLPLEAEQ